MSTKTPPNVIKLAFQRYCVVLALFVFVALMIVLLYAAMLLPIYQNMEVQL